mgnify:CR=1 FL=1
MTTDRPTPRVDKLLTDETGARVIFHGTFSAPLCELARHPVSCEVFSVDALDDDQLLVSQ